MAGDQARLGRYRRTPGGTNGSKSEEIEVRVEACGNQVEKIFREIGPFSHGIRRDWKSEIEDGAFQT